MSKKENKIRINSMQKAYLNDILVRRVAGYKSLANRILKDVPENDNDIKTIGNDSLVDTLKTKIDDQVKLFYTIFDNKKLKNSVSKLIGVKFKKKSQTDYKKFINSNKDVKKYFQKLEVSQGLKLDDLIDNENLKEYLDVAIDANVELIKTMDKDTFSSISKAVYQNIASGNSKDKLSDTLLKIGTSSEKKARSIAMDQTNKILENMNKQRSISLGATKFEWQTTGKKLISQGGSSRDEHNSFDGKIYTYKDGAGSRGILPGEDVNCQCTALPIFDEE